MGTAALSRTRSPTPREVLSALDRLPPFPAVALRALNVLSGTDSSLRELCDLVRCDPVFTAEIIRIANSPLIAFSKEVTSVMQASMLLGFRRLRRLVVTVGLRSYMENSVTPAMQSCWQHSLASAMMAERIARWNSIDCDFAFTAGILHDIGRVALATVSPQLFSDLVERAASEPGRDALRDERDVFGIDHCNAGRLLVAAWKLPKEFLDVAARHHEPLTGEEDVTEVVRLSCRLADALGFEAVRRGAVRSYQEVLAEFPEEAREHMPGEKELAGEIAKEIGVIDCA